MCRLQMQQKAFDAKLQTQGEHCLRQPTDSDVQGEASERNSICTNIDAEYTEVCSNDGMPNLYVTQSSI